MAFILKYSRSAVTIFGFVRITNSNHVNKEFVKLCSKRLPGRNALFFMKHFSSVSSKISKSVSKSIYELDLDSRTKCRVRSEIVEELLDLLKQTGKISYQDSATLLKACGSLGVNLKSKDRINLIEKVIGVYEEIGLKLDITHYNILLTAFIQNEHKFSVTEFLKILENKGIEPNKVTFQRLLRIHCQNGDIDGASKVLEKIKQKGLSLSEDIFNSLVLGHCQVNDVKSAKGIIEVMNEKGIKPTAETYVHLIYGHIRNKNFEEIQKVLSDCEDKGISFENKDFLDIIYMLAINNHHEEIHNFLKKLKKTGDFDNKASVYMLRLFEKNMDNVAFQIFDCIKTNSESLSNKGNVAAIGMNTIHFFLKYRPIHRALNFAFRMQKEGYMKFPVSYLFRYILLLKDKEKAFSLFKAMKQQNMPLQPHYFWPLIINASKKGGNEEILNVLERIKKLNVPLCITTCEKIIVPNYKFGDNWSVDLDRMENLGIRRDRISQKLYLTFLEENRLDDAEKLGSSTSFRIKNVYFVRDLVNFYNKSRNADVFVKSIYYYLHDIEANTAEMSESSSSSDSEKDETLHKDLIMKEAISKLLLKCDEDLILLALKKMCESKMGIPEDLYEQLQATHEKTEVKEALKDLVDPKLCFEYDETILNQKKLDQRQEERTLHLSKILDTLKNGNKELAMEMCEELKNFKDLPVKMSETFKYEQLLREFSKSGDVEAVQKAYDIGLATNIIQESYFYPMVHALFVSGQTEKATDMFLDMVEKFEAKPLWPSFLCHLIEIKNPDWLQKATDSMSKLEDEDFSAAMLITAFAKLGKVNEIKKILESKAFFQPSKCTDAACKWLYKKKSILGLETLLEATKAMNFVKPELIVISLLNLYSRYMETNKLKNLWLHIQEYNIVLSSHNKTKFQKVLNAAEDSHGLQTNTVQEQPLRTKVNAS